MTAEQGQAPARGSKSALAWLTARPIAHRGLHDPAQGIIENTPSAAAAAIACRYDIEADLQISADGEAMVHHDDILGRLTDGSGALRDITAAALGRVPFRATADRMMTLSDLVDLVAGRAVLVLELKSRWDDDRRLARRVAAVLASYAGPVAAMSFDPCQVAACRAQAPHLARGIVAERRPGHRRAEAAADRRGKLAYLVRAFRSRPQFIAYHVGDLPAAAPLAARHLFGLPLLAWTVRSDKDRRRAARWADQIIFEGFRP